MAWYPGELKKTELEVKKQMIKERIIRMRKRAIGREALKKAEEKRKARMERRSIDRKRRKHMGLVDDAKYGAKVRQCRMKDVGLERQQEEGRGHEL